MENNRLNPRILLLLICFLPTVYAAAPVWQVTSGPYKFFLGGTIHLLRASDYPLPPAFAQAYQQSDTLVFETDIGKSQSDEFRQKMIQAVQLPQGASLEDYLKPQTLAALDQYLRDNGMNIEQFSGMKPSMVSMTLTIMELRKLGAGETGVDAHFFSQAMTDHKPILALESIQQQIDFIASMGQGQEDLMIQQTLEDNRTMLSLFNEMVGNWRIGNEAQLKALFIDPMKDKFAPIYRDLLVNRNNNWMPQLHQMLKTAETELVLVGSAHLVGPEGLLHLLRQAGYRITQLD